MASAAPPATRPGLRRLDALLVALVLVLAFLAGCTPVRNSAFWMHLADGRLLAHGDFSFGDDPFVYTAAAPWVNHAWLFDLALYALYQTAGGVGVVLAKALLVVGMAEMLCRIRRTGSPLWLPACGAGLAVVASSPYLSLQPAIVSLLFLAVTMWLLPWRESADQRVWLLPPLFALWANCDAWFLLGPLTVALFWLGDRPRRLRLLGVLLVGVAACLLNPYHVRVFALPAELSPSVLGAWLEGDVRFQHDFASPWGATALVHDSAWLVPAGAAYYVLVAAGIASFVANRARLPLDRVLVWGLFALLGAWQMRLIPFFAIVAGPLTVLNLQGFAADYFGRATERARQWDHLRTVGRWLTVLAGAALAVAAGTGFLQNPPKTAHGIGWDVVSDPALQRTAETLGDWRAQGTLRDTDRVFSTDPELTDYCAWFAPGVKGFLDHRLERSPEATADYLRASHALVPTLAVGDAGGDDWRPIFERRGIALLVSHDADTQRALPPLGRLWLEPADWTLLDLRGATAIFACNRADDGARFDALRFDPDAQVFGQPRDDQPPAPGRAPYFPDQPRGAADEPVGPPTVNTDTAQVLLEHFEDVNVHQFVLPDVLSTVALCAQAATPPSPAPAATAWFLYSKNLYRSEADGGPAAVAYLAVRAARRAVADDRFDAAAYLWLGTAYFALQNHTRDGLWAARLRPLRLLRHAQTVGALEETVRLDPNRLDAHLKLLELYRDGLMLDAALDHWSEVNRLALKPNEASEPEYKELQDEVRNRLHLWEVRARGTESQPVVQARHAVNLGLHQKALRLLQARSDEIGPDGMRLEAELLLLLGQVSKARALLNSERVRQTADAWGNQEIPGLKLPGLVAAHRLPAHLWLLFQVEAVTGNYEAAEAALAGMLDRLRDDAEQRADLNVLGGVLALEQGQPDAARRFFDASLATGANDFAGRPQAVVLRQRLRAERK